MGLFKKNRPKLSDALGKTIKSPIPAQHFDITKRYDIYCEIRGEYRLYQNVRLVAFKTLEDIRENGGMFRSFLEIETADETRMMIPGFPIHLICEHGVKPVYVVLKQARDDAE